MKLPESLTMVGLFPAKRGRPGCMDSKTMTHFRHSIRTIVRAALLGFALQWLAGVQPASGILVGYWPMDGDWTDSSGNSHHGTAGGNPTFATGMVGQAGDFDGTGDRVIFSSPVDNTPPFTASIWVQTDFLPPNPPGGDQNNKYIFSNGGQTSGSIGLSMRLEYYWGQPQWHGSVRLADGTVGYVGTPLAFPTTDWTHLTLVWDGTTATDSVVLYVNGTDNVFTGTPGTGSVGSPDDLRIGGPSNSTSYLWDGRLDEAGLWNEALTATEVDTLYRHFGGDIAAFEASGRVPEPSSSLILLTGLTLLLGRRRR